MAGSIERTPGDKSETIGFAPVAATPNSNDIAVWTAPHNVYIQRIQVVFREAINGVPTDYFSLRIQDDARSASDVMELGRLTFDGGLDAAVGDPLTIVDREDTDMALQGRRVLKGSTLYLSRRKFGAGLAMPGGSVTFTYRTSGTDYQGGES